MSPECIVGQVRQTFTNHDLDESRKKFKENPVAKYWDGKFACKEYELIKDRNRDIMLTLDFEDGQSYEASGAEIYDLVFNKGKPWCITSNGTIFTFEKQGVVPGLLELWYAERQEMQAKAKLFRNIATGLELPDRLKV